MAADGTLHVHTLAYLMGHPHVLTFTCILSN